MREVARASKKFFVAVAGMTILGIGVLLLALPGPGLLVIILGLIVLASEFAWAQGALDKARAKYQQTKEKIKQRTSE